MLDKLNLMKKKKNKRSRRYRRKRKRRRFSPVCRKVRIGD
jgi:hypothetical protein